MGRAFILLCLFVTLPVASGQGLPELGDASGTVLSPQMERRIGEEAMRDIRFRDPSYLDDPELTAYINSIGHRLTAANPEARLDFEFFMVRDSTINAFAMPGGFVGVHTGLLVAAQSESEVASVLAHEIAHVTQHHIARMLGKQQQMSVPTLAAMVIAVLAARANPQVAQGALTAISASAIQSQLDYSRDFEREADRVGFQTLERSGFDVHAMDRFFERLQKFGRLYENNAPAYLRTHPITSERIADMQDRAQSAAYKQTPDSLEFQLVRAKIRVEQGAPSDALAVFEEQIRTRRFSNEAAARYGLAAALARSREYARAETAVAELRGMVRFHPIVELLAARIKAGAGDTTAALGIVMTAIAHHPDYRPLRYAQVDYLQTLGEHPKAIAALDDLLKIYPHDARFFDFRAKSFSALGKRLLQHQALAESYVLKGAVVAAIEQLQLARKSGDGDFYQLSSVEARLRQLRLMKERENRREGTRGGP
ncbi:MAG: peptidase M48 [Betaproteobacteria bacterium RIFCSPLOWO2_12_FULL_63_13]|nr:MAG: peptidase M48 [Betaproteobacteria bacterium RIFCSPLOWO2_12_FULL_63_13]